ncbi:MAG: hypothetical protein GWQ05_05575 [Verrucomicrobiaceae bacterium]|jgi:hypothetical protein|nr:hypothetical protein [Verrucomicrobiaceae bacterium]
METYVDFRTFRGVLTSFDNLFRQAADFATSVGKQDLISISHSEDGDDGVVTVWYWNHRKAGPSY